VVAIMAYHRVLVIDAGGTNTRCEIRDADGNPIVRHDLLTLPNDYKGWEVQLQDGFERGYGFSAIGLAVAGNVQNGVLTASGNLPGWAGVDLAGRLSDLFGVPTSVLNDCAASALGEYAAFERLGQSQPLTYFGWGTGAGVAFVSFGANGKPEAEASELGHMFLNHTSSVRCGCGGFGHLEAFVSGKNLERRFGVKSGSEVSDKDFMAVLDDLAAGLRVLSAVKLDSRPIVMGGGISFKREHLLGDLRKRVKALKMSCDVPEILLSEAGEDNGLIGATYAAQMLLA
jgi:glucokinase